MTNKNSTKNTDYGRNDRGPKRQNKSNGQKAGYMEPAPTSNLEHPIQLILFHNLKQIYLFNTSPIILLKGLIFGLTIK